MSDDDPEAGGVLGRVAGAVTGRVVHAVDPDAVLDQIDVDRLVRRIDADALIARVDPNALLDRVDPNALLDRVDVDRLLDHVDVNRLLDQVDVNRLLDRADVDRLLERADVKGIVDRSGVPEMVTRSAGQLGGSIIDVARRQVVGLDTIIDRTLDRVFRRTGRIDVGGPPALRHQADEAKEGTTSVSGEYAGPLSRFLALAADVALAAAAFTLTVAGLQVLVDTFVGRSFADLSGGRTGPVGLVAWALWLFVYAWGSLAIVGRTPGKALVGLRVVTAEGHPAGIVRTFVRTLAFPLSGLLAGLGFLLAVVQPQHRALHDLVGGTAVVYDWGDRPAELPGPVAAYVSSHT